MAKQQLTGAELYARRKARYLARHPGATVQQARGKKAGEHIIRAEKEGRPPPRPRVKKPVPTVKSPKPPSQREQARRRAQSLGTLSKSDKDYVRRYAKIIASRNGEPLDEIRPQALAYATRVGMDHFKKQVKIVRAANKEYQAGFLIHGGTGYISHGEALLQLWQLDDGFPNANWYFYH